MTDLLSAIGLSSATPDPADFLKQKEVADQIGQARADATSTLGSISFALDAAETFGVSSTSLSSLRSLQDRAKKLTDSTNLTPAQMEAERSRIEQDLAKVKAEQDELGRQAELRSVKDLLATISSERAQIIADSTLPADLGTSAKGLEERAKASLDAVQKAVNAKQELPSTVDTAATLTAALQSLKDQREDAENKTSAGLTGILRTGKRWGKLGLIAIILLGSAILGGSIVANAFVDEVFWGIRLYYFVYGALGFPLSLLYGIIRPPIWQATILPWSLDENPDVVFSTNYFSYHLFTEEELTQAPPSGTVPRTTLLESGRAMLRWLSMGGLISSAIATYVAVKH